MQILEITVAVPCKKKCEYCPQDVLKKAYKGVPILTFDLFEKAMKNVLLDVVIHFSGMCEPYQNPDIIKMIKHVDGIGYKVALSTTIDYFPKDVRLYKEYYHIVNSIKDPISRAGNLFKTKRKKEGLRCSESNYDNNIMMPNGDVYLCCMDYGLKHKLGNLLKTPFLKLNRKPPFEICRYCELSETSKLCEYCEYEKKEKKSKEKT